MSPRLNKKAVSLIVSYVLLISIGLSIAGLVYGWLRFYVDIEDTVKCPDGVSLIIMQSDYHQSDTSGGELSLNLTLENKGRFNISSYVIRVGNRTNAKIGTIRIYHPDLDGLPTTGEFPLGPGESTTHQFNYSYLGKYVSNRICFIEVQPIIIDDEGSTLACSQISTRKVDCFDII